MQQYSSPIGLTGKYCLCGDSYGRYGPSSNCTMPCSGNASVTCGNHLIHDVYKVPVATQTDFPPHPE